MDKQLLRRIETVSSTESERFHNLAAAKLADISENPDEWEYLLKYAQEDLYSAMELADNLSDYYRASILRIASPLYTLPSILETVDPVTLKKGLGSTRRSLIKVVQELDRESQTYGRDAEQLMGLANETAILAALMQSNIIDEGYVAVPALPWQDRDYIAPLEYKAGRTQLDVNYSFDIAMLPLVDHKQLKKIQVKTGKTSKVYADEIRLVNCAEISKSIQAKPPRDVVMPRKQSPLLYKLFRQPHIAQCDSLARAIYLELESQLRLDSVR